MIMSGLFVGSNSLENVVANYPSNSPIHQSLCFKLSSRDYFTNDPERLYLMRRNSTDILEGWWGNVAIDTGFNDTNEVLPFATHASGFVPHRPNNLSSENWGVRRISVGERRWYRYNNPANPNNEASFGIWESTNSTDGVNGTWTVLKQGHSLMIVDMVGGGGGGGNPNTGSGSNTASGGGGGGSGAFFSFAVDLQRAGRPLEITVGGGGSGPTSGDTDGDNGRATIAFMYPVPGMSGTDIRSFAMLMQASGGRGGLRGGSGSSSAGGGAGGVGGASMQGSVDPVGGIILLSTIAGNSGGRGGRTANSTNAPGAQGGSYRNEDGHFAIPGAGITPDIRYYMPGLRGVGGEGAALMTDNANLPRRAGGGGGGGSALGIPGVGFGAGGAGGSRSTAGAFSSESSRISLGRNGSGGIAILHY